MVLKTGFIDILRATVEARKDSQEDEHGGTGTN